MPKIDRKIDGYFHMQEFCIYVFVLAFLTALKWASSVGKNLMSHSDAPIRIEQYLEQNLAVFIYFKTLVIATLSITI